MSVDQFKVGSVVWVCVTIEDVILGQWIYVNGPLIRSENLDRPVTYQYGPAVNTGNN